MEKAISKNKDSQNPEEELVRRVAEASGQKATVVKAVIALLGDGATIPFISRYRKELTGGMDEVGVRAVETALKRIREFMVRREFVGNAITEAGKMTPHISEMLAKAGTIAEIEDIYSPFKPKRRTRATAAREKGLEPLAAIIMAGRTADCSCSAQQFVGKNGVESVDDALAGASDIIAEWASDSPRLRNITRNEYRRNGVLEAAPARGKSDELAASPFAQYAKFAQSVRRMASHQYLALRRAEREGLLKVKYTLDDRYSRLGVALEDAFIPRQASRDCAKLVAAAVADSASRLLRPSVETEISEQLKEEADRVAIDIFADNLRQLLLASPLRGRRILAIDPGYRTGCKVAALDAQGNLLAHDVIYPTAPRNDIRGAHAVVERLVNRYKLDSVALGSGTASRETEQFLKNSGILPKEAIFVVSEDGASVYSASEIGRKEFPDYDVTVRGAVSIGRRLIDPLAELVKIDPKSIGVGQYQHDVDQSRLKDALDFTVMSCVNAVGVDVNTASVSLLQYVSGIGHALAEKIVEYRGINGPFRSRRELKNVPRLGDKAFEQAAGFLRITDGDEPLDNTGIHPESYALVRRMAASVGAKPEQLPANKALLDSIDVEALAKEGVGGLETMRDIVSELRKPGRDPRDEDASAAFIPGVESFEHVCVGQTLPGKVVNITAFGAFVDLGIKENGLLHISRLGRRVAAVSDVLHLGQQIEVEVEEVETARRRIGLRLVKA